MEFVMNIILSSVRMATPLIFLALAELYSQRAGLVHIGLEGLASIGSLVGFLVSLITGSPMLGVLAGAAVGILVNMIFAYATVTLCAEQIVYGMAINIFAPALAAFIYRVYFGAGSELVQVGLMNTLSSSLGITSDNFLVRLLLDQTPMVYLAYGLVIFTVIYFNRTKSGLNYKAVGEYPKAAETLAIVRWEGGLNAYQVASRMTWDIRADSWADFPLNQKWFATGEALAHLEYLAEEGAVVRTLDQEGMARYTAQ